MEGLFADKVDAWWKGSLMARSIVEVIEGCRGVRIGFHEGGCKRKKRSSYMKCVQEKSKWEASCNKDTLVCKVGKKDGHQFR